MPEAFTLDDIALTLRAERCPTDHAFDRFLPDALRAVSDEYWTPLRVAVRAASWFNELEIRSVVDIGAGAGKFCVAAALASSSHYAGLEQRPWLVEAARTLARTFQVEGRVEFIQGELGEGGAPLGELYYFFNPFGENLFMDGHLDEDVELSDARFARDVAAAEDLLQHAPTGTYALTYNGFGGSMPGGYELLRTADFGLSRELSLWRKLSEHARGRLAPRQGAQCPNAAIGMCACRGEHQARGSWLVE